MTQVSSSSKLSDLDYVKSKDLKYTTQLQKLKKEVQRLQQRIKIINRHEITAESLAALQLYEVLLSQTQELVQKTQNKLILVRHLLSMLTKS